MSRDSQAELPRCFGVLGQPIAHSRSPAMHGAAFEALGLPHRYLPFAVAPGQLAAAVHGAAALGFGGLNLTVPHKQAALALCDELSESARRIGAVNTLQFAEGGRGGPAIIGHNTDAPGFLAALDELPGAPLRRATVLGSGGASLAIVDALLSAHPQLELVWVSRRPADLRARVPAVHAERVQPRAWSELEGEAGRLGGQLLVNTTIVGLAGGPQEYPVPLQLETLEPRARVVDIVYPRPAGGLLERAAGRGFGVQDGLPMLLWQGVRALELWLGEELPAPAVEAMRGAIRG